MPKFRLYNGKLRLQGSVLNEVPLTGVTAPEVDVLRAIHGGDDAVIELKPAGSAEREHSAERERLAEVYAGASFSEKDREKKMRLITDLFGNARLPLPLTLEEVAEAKEEASNEPAPKPRPTRTKVEKPEEAAFAE